MNSYQSCEDGAGLVIIKHEGKRASEVLEDLVGRVWPAVAQRPVGLDHQQSLVRVLAQSILPDQRAQVIEAPKEHTVYVIKAAEQPASQRT